MIDKKYLQDFIDNAIREDVGDGDHTSLSCIPAGQKGKARLLVKQDGIIAGVHVAEQIFKTLEPASTLQIMINDGAPVKNGDVVFTVEATVHTLLMAERLVLNVMQRMSGISTQTSIYVEKLKGTNSHVLDTRKTTPGMRLFDKMAVKLGGGMNHRIGLYDMILIKDNHIDFAGGIENAIRRANDYCSVNSKRLNIEIEARNLADVQTILNTGKIHRIMFDNFDIDTTKKAVAMVNRKYETESSGNITLDNIRSYAECGVDYISVGALTHQIRSLDLSLKAIF